MINASDYPPCVDVPVPALHSSAPIFDCVGEEYGRRIAHDMSWAQLFVGAGGTGMVMHTDRAHAHVSMVQLKGPKQFVFCPPGMAKPFDAFPFARSARSSQTKHTDGDTGDGMEPCKPGCTSTQLNPGDLVYWPSWWWHQSHNPIVASETGASETVASETGASETGASETGASEVNRRDKKDGVDDAAGAAGAGAGHDRDYHSQHWSSVSVSSFALDPST